MTAATDIFWKHEFQNRPSVVPPHSVNGGNAATGGQANPLHTERKRKKDATGDDDDDDDDDDDGHEPEDDEDDPSGELRRGAAAKEPKPMNLGGSGTRKYRPKTMRKEAIISEASLEAALETVLKKCQEADAVADEKQKRADAEKRAADDLADMALFERMLAMAGSDGAC